MSALPSIADISRSYFVGADRPVCSSIARSALSHISRRSPPPLAVLPERNIRCIGILDPNNMISRIHVMNFASHAARHVGKKIDTGLSDVFQREIAPQWRVVLIPLQNIAKIPNPRGGERVQWSRGYS